jgi:5,10-methenyltetrahydrofolate synthetase
LLIPLLAFDGKRNRLGYGGGYYDRTIEKQRARESVLAIGVAYSFQEINGVPVLSALRSVRRLHRVSIFFCNQGSKA